MVMWRQSEREREGGANHGSESSNSIPWNLTGIRQRRRLLSCSSSAFALSSVPMTAFINATRPGSCWALFTDSALLTLAVGGQEQLAHTRLQVASGYLFGTECRLPKRQATW